MVTDPDSAPAVVPLLVAVALVMARMLLALGLRLADFLPLLATLRLTLAPFLPVGPLDARLHLRRRRGARHGLGHRRH